MDEKVYDRTITNKYLGVQRIIKGGSPLETRIKAESQLAKWARQEKLHKERERFESLKELAALDTRQAGNTIKACDSILKINLCSAGKLDWASFYHDQLLPPFVFTEHPPRYEQVARKMSVPRKSFISELIFPSARKKRLALEEAARVAFEEQMRNYNANKESAQTSYEAQRAAFINEQSEFNRSVDQLQLDVEKGQPYAVASLARIALAGLELPDEIEVDFDAHYHGTEKLIVLSGILPGPLEMPRIVRYEYHEEENGILPVEMDQDSFDNFYESTLLQIALSAVHRIFTSIPDRQIHIVGFNGLIAEGESCLFTCKTSRDLFNPIDLARNTPDMSFQAMQGVMVKPLTALTPVEPLAWPTKPTFLRPETGELITRPDGRRQPAAYQSGEIKNAANDLLVGLLDQLEQDLSKKPRDGDVVH
ncbi:hypothetical protein Psfp_01370 [Pelotomaculum sp. FP]|uniref:hypothetical protein n=1 Tax=Pelotomaculum sp. FP TaxID=261474 RepID=UPI001064C625|nr:hypothetical protein [Pelotomaculum sp. FP]TEB16345.1 hypothetical protein Psfp_01370 [Pelotomaculum sp. FP]